MRRAITRAPLVVIFAWALIYVAPGLRPGYVLLPRDLLFDIGAWKPDPNLPVGVSNRVLSDTVFQQWPWSDFARRTLATGRIPWINPHQGNGEPFVANPQTALLSPFSWPPLMLPETGWAISVLLKLLVAGFGMRTFALTVGASERAALLSGLVYAGSGLLILWAPYPLASVAAFLPWLGTATLLFIREPSPKRCLAVILAAAGVTAGGHPETLLVGVVGIAMFILWETLPFREEGHRKSRKLALAAGSAACGFLLLSVLLVPFLFVLRGSPVRVKRLARGAEPFRGPAVIAQVLPGYLGGPLQGELDLSRAVSNAENFSARTTSYVGAIVLLALAVSFRRLEPPVRRGLVLAVVALFASWRAPPLDLVLRHFPGFSMVASVWFGVVFVLFASLAAGPALEVLEKAKPSRFLGGALLVVGLGLGAAATAPSIQALRPLLKRTALNGVERLRSRGALPHATAVYEARLDSYLASGARTALRRFAIPGLAIALAGAALLANRNRWLLTVAALGELLSFGVGFLPAVPASSVPGAPPAISDLLRVDPASEWAFASTDTSFPPDLATLYGLHDIAAYDALEVSPAAALLRETGWDVATLTFRKPLTDVAVGRLAAGGVRYFLARSPVAGSTRIGGGAPPAVGLYERPDAIPPARAPNVPPKGFGAGLALSLAALLSVPILLRTSRMGTYSATTGS